MKNKVFVIILALVMGVSACAQLPIKGLSVDKEDGTKFMINQEQVVFQKNGRTYTCVPQGDLMDCTFKDKNGNEISVVLDATVVKGVLNNDGKDSN